MRVVLTCWGSFGDLFPTLSLARALCARGHDAIVATCPFYQSIIEREGLTFRPVRPDIDPDDRALAVRIMNPAKGSEVVVREVMAARVRASYDDLISATEGADVLISHPITFAAPIVADVRRMPWLSTTLAPLGFFSAYDFPILPTQTSLMSLARTAPFVARGLMRLVRRITRAWTMPVRDLRRALGLPDRGDPLYDGQYSPHGHLALFSPMLGRAQPDWPAPTTMTGFPWFDGDAALPESLERFLRDGPPPLVFTLGTSAVLAPGAFYDQSVRAARAIGRRAVLLVGRQAEGVSAPRWPDDVIAVEYVSHAALFPRAAAVVHQGGIGTTGQALRAGVPTLVVPHAHDQPDNAARVVRLGVGQTIDARRYTAARAAEALRALVSESRYADRARQIGAVVSAEDGARVAADAIETLALRTEPRT